MSSKSMWVLMGVLIAIAYFAGRYSAPEKITEDKTKDQMISELNRQLAFKSSDAIQVTTTVVKPDGTRVTRVRVENKVVTVTVHDTQKESITHETDHKVIENRRGVVVSALVGIGLSDLTGGLKYGVSVQKQVLGPINLGAFGFNDGRIGLSVGLEF